MAYRRSIVLHEVKTNFEKKVGSLSSELLKSENKRHADDAAETADAQKLFILITHVSIRFLRHHNSLENSLKL